MPKILPSLLNQLLNKTIKSHNMPKFYYLTCNTTQNCNVLITLNGFPLHQGILYKDINTPFIVNVYLISNQNTLSFELLPIEPIQNDLNLPSKVNIDVKLRSYEAGEIVTPEDGQVILLTEVAPGNLTLPSSEVDVKLDFPLHSNIDYHFNQSDFNYAQLLVGQPQIVSTTELERYGHYLLELFRQQNIAQLMHELAPKIHHLSTSHGIATATINSELRSLILEMMQLGLDETLEYPLIVRARPWCNQRLFELYVEPDKELLSTKENEEGLMKMPVFVAAVNGGVKIVR